jgi:hypothetical protein
VCKYSIKENSNQTALRLKKTHAFLGSPDYWVAKVVRHHWIIKTQKVLSYYFVESSEKYILSLRLPRLEQDKHREKP